MRTAQITRRTTETEVQITLSLDGTGSACVTTGIGFLDHMLHQVAQQGLFDLEVKAVGDLHVDDHHTIEDVARGLGDAFRAALGDKRGIRRYGSFILPMDEALAGVFVDFSGRLSLCIATCWRRRGLGIASWTWRTSFFKALPIEPRQRFMSESRTPKTHTTP